jgi:hypothetical protein
MPNPLAEGPPLVSCPRLLIHYVPSFPPIVKTDFTDFTVTHGAEPFLRSHQLSSCSRISQHFMEPEGLLPCSQGPSADPYPEPDQSNQYHPMISI